MNWLAENSLAIWMLGTVALTLALVIYFQTRTNRALYGVAAVVIVTAALLLTSWLIETPREAVERTCTRWRQPSKPTMFKERFPSWLRRPILNFVRMSRH